MVRLAVNIGKFFVVAAMLMEEPNPGVMRTWPWKDKYSATILAFQAPPAAVTHPVIRAGKILGKKSLVHISQRDALMRSAAYRNSFGIRIAPAKTLKRTYHWTPSNIRNMELIPKLSLAENKSESAKG